MRYTRIDTVRKLKLLWNRENFLIAMVGELGELDSVAGFAFPQPCDFEQITQTIN